MQAARVARSLARAKIEKKERDARREREREEKERFNEYRLRAVSKCTSLERPLSNYDRALSIQETEDHCDELSPVEFSRRAFSDSIHSGGTRGGSSKYPKH